MDRHAAMHPRNRRHRKLQITRDNLAMLFERIDDQIRAARRVRREPNLLRYTVDKLRNLPAYLFTAGEPRSPMNVAVIPHLLVIKRTRFRRRLRQWSSRSSV